MMSEVRPWLALRAAPVLAAALSAISTPSLAQETAKPKRDLLVTIGGGASLSPRYPGADGPDVFPIPVFDIGHVGDPVEFEAPDEGIGLGLLGDDKKFNFGPAVQLQSSRRDKDVGAPVGKVGFTVEAGAFVQAWLARNLRLRVEARQGIGGHESLLGDVSADFVARDGDRTIFSIGPRARLSDAGYQRAYFGVSPAASTATGLPVYRPGSGVYAVGIFSGLNHKFNATWGMKAYAGYDRLMGDAADSPLVRRYGSRDQLSGGLALTYTFRIHRGPKAR
jgi:outer membrane protein